MTHGPPTETSAEDGSNVADVRVHTLEQIVVRGQVWSRMAEKHGVTNPVPPWKTSLDAMCDALDSNGEALPLATRREDEDLLSDNVYEEVPFPERQLVTLAHSLVARGVIDESALARRMAEVRTRLETT